ncbi:RING-H2 finger protein ATL3 [Striga hermonthica]|uniref:RING-type E3 ubiquitin transferase n=1 Tax=Striga hermonthica TaxID=68872 RepID=A0A9N7RH17_STRHE|nr:RING-H2 finger protein ATL3 [Striga hermonthica]
MADSSERFANTDIIELTGKIMVVAIVLLLFVVVFVFCLHLYAKYFWYRRPENPVPAPEPLPRRRRRRRRRFDFADGYPELSVSRRGLDPSVLRALPVIMFDPEEFKDGLECAVCLSDISQGEKTRLLPKCSHGFHLDCIDMWFESHSTCPLCRNPVKNPNGSGSSDEPQLDSIVIQIPAVENSGEDSNFQTETPNFPTNVLIWGDETQVSTFTPSVEDASDNDNNNVVFVEQSPSLSSSSVPVESTSSLPEIARQVDEEDEQKSSVPARIKSIKKLLSYNHNNRRVNPSSSINSDIEQDLR